MAPASFADSGAHDAWFTEAHARLTANGRAAIDKALAELDRMEGAATIAPPPPSAVPGNVRR